MDDLIGRICWAVTRRGSRRFWHGYGRNWIAQRATKWLYDGANKEYERMRDAGEI